MKNSLWTACFSFQNKLWNMSTSLENIMTSTKSSVRVEDAYGEKLNAGLVEVSGLLKLMGDGFRHLRLYRCKESIESFNRLPIRQYDTSWVQCQVIARREDLGPATGNGVL